MKERRISPNVSYEGKLRIATIQAASVWLDIDGTIEKSIKLIEEAAANGAQLVAFPELWIPGYPWFLYTKCCSEWPAMYLLKYHENSMHPNSDHMRRLQDAARKNHIAVAMGFSEKDGGTRYMSNVLIGADGMIQGIRRKFKPTFVERTLFGEGDGSDFRVFDMGFGRVGMLNCWEHIQPLVKYTMNGLMEQIHIAAWPAITQPHVYAYSEAVTDTLTRAYALETQTFVLSSSHVVDQACQDLMAHTEKERNWIWTGGGTARIYSPDGTDLATPLAPDEEGILYADIDLSDILVAKATADQLGHYSKPSIFNLQVNNAPMDRITFSRPITDSVEDLNNLYRELTLQENAGETTAE